MSGPRFQRGDIVNVPTPHASTIRCHKMFVCTETMVHQRRGEASPRIMREVESRLRDLLAL